MKKRAGKLSFAVFILAHSAKALSVTVGLSNLIRFEFDCGLINDYVIIAKKKSRVKSNVCWHLSDIRIKRLKHKFVLKFPVAPNPH